MYKFDSKAMRPILPTRRVAHLLIALQVCLSLLLTACSSEDTSDKKAETNDQTPAANKPDTGFAAARQDTKSVDIQYTPPNVPYDLNGTPVEIAGARFVPATQWEDLGSSGEMVAHYRYGPLEKDTNQAEVTVFFFGNQTGDFEKIMDRWIGQISLTGGRDSRLSARRHDRQVGGMTAHVLSMDGIYTPPADGFDREDRPVREYYRLVGVVIEAPGGNIYFKLTGPDYTARVMIDHFMNMIYRVIKV